MFCRTSALRSSQNSLQSSVVTTQRPASAYYPPPMSVNVSRSNLHQSIPNLKSPPSVHRLQSDDNRAGSYPSVNQHHQSHNNYPNTNHHPRSEESNSQRSYNSSYQTQSLKDSNSSYSNPLHASGTVGYNNNVHHVHSNGQRPQDIGSGLLREDIVRHSQNARHEEIMRYLNANNTKNSEQNYRLQEDGNRPNEMRVSKSDDMLKQHLANQNPDMMRYASSGNIRTQESSKVEIPLYRMKDEEESDLRIANNVRSQKIVENLDMRKKSNRMGGSLSHQPPNLGYQQQSPLNSPGYHPHQQQYYSSQHNSPYSPSYNMSQNTQSMQNLTLNQPYSQQQQQQQIYPGYQYYSGQNVQQPTSPTYKSPPIAPKPSKRIDDPPELPPTSTHPLYSASSQDLPKMAFYPTTTTAAAAAAAKTPRDPWAREEQERQAEARREASRQWQEQQIRELQGLSQRTTQQDEQLRVLQLEREFQRRALEASEMDDDDTEKVSCKQQCF